MYRRKEELTSSDKKLLEYFKIRENETGAERVARTKYQINYYVEDVMKLIAPENLYKDDRDKLRELLTLITTLSVFNMQLNSCWELKQAEMINQQTNPTLSSVEMMSSESEIIRTRVLLDKTSFNSKFGYIMLRLKDNKRFSAGKKWISTSGTKPLTDPERSAKLQYSKGCKLASVEDILSTDRMNLHHESACMLRDHLSLVGELWDINMDSPEIKKVKEITDVLILKFESLYDIVTGHSQKPFIDSEFVMKETMYLEACRTMRRLLSLNVMKAFDRKRSREKYTAKEFKIGTRYALKCLEKELISLPQNESQHQEYITHLSKKIVDTLAKMGRTISNPREKYHEFIQKEYERYMKRIKDGTLPIRLSYLPEDKELFEKMLVNPRNKQERLKRTKIIDLDDSDVIWQIPLSMTALAVSSLMSQNPLRTAGTITLSAITAYTLGCVLKHIQVNRDVSKDLRIRNLSIKKARGKYYRQTLNPPKDVSQFNKPVLPQENSTHLTSESRPIIKVAGPLTNQMVQRAAESISKQEIYVDSNEN